jgi:hypothetical protein
VPQVVEKLLCQIEVFSNVVILNPWVDSASNRNKYQEYLVGVKAAGT